MISLMVALILLWGMFELWSSADKWDDDEENEAFPTYVIRKVLIKKWEWFLELDQDEELYRQKVAHEPCISWDDDAEYDGADKPNDEFGGESSSDESTDSKEERGGFGG
jgi:hypothetical protein